MCETALFSLLSFRRCCEDLSITINEKKMGVKIKELKIKT